MKKLKHAIIMTMIGGIFLTLAACSDGEQFLPEQVINNAVSKTVDPVSYYAEAEMKTEGFGETEHVIIKEWVDEDGKRRTEAQLKEGSDLNISVNDGTKLIHYNEEMNQAYVINNDEVLAELNQMSPKEQANRLLVSIQQTHEISAAGEEEIAGRKAYHLIAKAKEPSSLVGDQELWIDKENWVVLKMISTSGDFKSELLFTKFELQPNLSPDLFTIELPDDVELIDFEELSPTKNVSLEEAVNAIGQSFLYFPEEQDRIITQIELVELKGEINRNEVNIDYELNGLPSFTLTIFPTPEDGGLELLPGEKEVKIRENTGTYLEFNDFRSLVWQEDGLSYSVIFVDPNVTLEQFAALADDMVPAQ